MSSIAILATIIVIAVILFVWNRLPVVIVAMGTALALYVTGVLSLEEALSGLGDPAVIFIATLFIVSAGLEATGLTTWAGQMLIAKAGEESRTRLLVLTSLLVAFLTALISVNGAVAALLPVVVVMAVRLKRPTSQLLMPLVFSAHAGSLLALTGSPVNVLISDAAGDAGLDRFGFFEFALVGVPLLLGSIAIIVLFGERLLPHSVSRKIPADLSSHAETLVEQYGLSSDAFQMRVRASSPFAGAPLASVDLASFPDLQLIAVKQEDGSPLKRPNIAEGDFFILRGSPDAAVAFAAQKHLAFREQNAAAELQDTLFNRNSGLAEVIIPPRSGMIGTSVFPGMITESGDLIVLAVQRRGTDLIPNETDLEAGDTLLLQGTWKALDLNLKDPDVLMVNSPEAVRRQAVPLGAGAKQTVVILLAMVVMLATGVVPPVIAGLLAGGAMILTGVLTVEQSFRAINWTTVILVGALLPLSTAMYETGAAGLLADGLVSLVGDSAPILLLAGLFVLTACLGQLISNTATALIVIPIALAAAQNMDISPRPVLISVGVAAAAAFLTPVATATNLMVMAPGGYKFSDYWKLGLPLLIWFFIVATFYVPLVWRF